jgi:hypothetical protein
MDITSNLFENITASSCDIHAHKVISDAFLIFKFHEITLIYNYEIQKLIFIKVSFAKSNNSKTFACGL